MIHRPWQCLAGPTQELRCHSPLEPPPGALVFDLEGIFAGVTLESGDRLAIVPARHVLAAVRRMRDAAAAEPARPPQ
jgi:hypothetical protein